MRRGFGKEKGKHFGLTFVVGAFASAQGHEDDGDDEDHDDGGRHHGQDDDDVLVAQFGQQTGRTCWPQRGLAVAR